jgi:ABC-type oligopeptide transport system ATPase subunit
VLELQGLSRRYGDVVALDDLSFTVREGQMFGFVGPNGAGKTTTMRIVLGVLEPDRGEVRWRGRPVDAETRRRFGYMPEDHGQTFSHPFARIRGTAAAHPRSARPADSIPPPRSETDPPSMRPRASATRSSGLRVEAAAAAAPHRTGAADEPANASSSFDWIRADKTNSPPLSTPARPRSRVLEPLVVSSPTMSQATPVLAFPGRSVRGEDHRDVPGETLIGGATGNCRGQPSGGVSSALA